MNVSELMGLLLTVPDPDHTEVVVRETAMLDDMVEGEKDLVKLVVLPPVDRPTDAEDVHLDGHRLLILVGIEGDGDD